MVNEHHESRSKEENYLSAIRRELDMFELRERDFRARARQEQAQRLTERLRLPSSDLFSSD